MAKGKAKAGADVDGRTPLQECREALRGGSVLARRAAAEELARSARGCAEPQAVAELLRGGLADADGMVRWWSAFGLGACPDDPATVLALAKAVADPERGVRDAAAFALQFHGESARPALPALLRALTDADAGTRESARMALLALQPSELPNWPALRTALPHISDELPALARAALVWLEEGSSP